MFSSIATICVGASLGAVSRWLLGTWLNAWFPAIPPGTLAANLIGGYLVGVAIGFFGDHPGLAPEWRLLVITGFLGGMTTFSTFSAEVTALIQEQRAVMAGLAVSAHVLGSLAMTFAGFATIAFFRRLV